MCRWFTFDRLSAANRRTLEKVVTRKLTLALPAGSLQQSTFELLRHAGWEIHTRSRSYYPTVNDEELDCILMRPQEISRYVEQGALDAGLTGRDWVMENGSDVEIVQELVYAKQQMRPVRWVLAVPDRSPIRSVQDLKGKRIATELVNGVRRWLDTHNVSAHVEFSWGATEVKVPEFVDAIVDITETGASLRANKLRIVDTVVESVTQLVANKQAWTDPWKRRKLDALAVMLQGAIVAREKVGLKMNVPEHALSQIVDQLPAMKRPTVANLTEPGWVAVETIIDESVARTIIPELKRLGAEAIIEYPLNKVLF